MRNGITFMPKEYTRWKQDFALLSGMKGGEAYGNARIVVSICCIFSVPKSCSKKEAQARLEGGVPRGDCDNLAKSVLDAMQDCGLIDDDVNVISLNVNKAYGEADLIDVAIEKAP